MENTQLDPGQAASPQPPEGPVRSPMLAGQPAESGELRALGDFRILRRLGEGGMGAVYLAYDGLSRRQVALKVLNDNLAGNQSYVDRFYREAKSGALLDHPNIVRTYSAGQDRGTGKHYLVMEYVDGPSAQSLLTRQGPLSVGDTVHLGLEIARALEHAHSRNIVHRDIKPDNILLTQSGVAKLADMGLAKRTDDPSHLTLARQGFGTTAYMPYEQAINAKQADGRSDIYALGATLYHLVTGQVPFPGDNHLEVVEKKGHGWFPPASSVRSQVPPVLDTILARMMARLPRDRYQTASELLNDLERSRLAVAVPSYADPDLARNDPQVLACVSQSEPTRLDPESPAHSQADEWIVRYRNRSGRPFTTRLTSEDVIERLKEGTLPAGARARRPNEEKARRLEDIPEFQPFLPPEELEEIEPVPAPAEAERTEGSWHLPAMVISSVVLAVGLIVLIVRYCWLRG